jgi:nucleotide-binding universal stress UspA family protein
VRYVTLSGAPLPDAVRDLAQRERADAIVIGQNAIAGDESASGLLAGAPCVVLVAPVGHRFRRPPAATRRNGVVNPAAK